MTIATFSVLTANLSGLASAAFLTWGAFFLLPLVMICVQQITPTYIHIRVKTYQVKRAKNGRFYCDIRNPDGSHAGIVWSRKGETSTALAFRAHEEY